MIDKKIVLEKSDGGIMAVWRLKRAAGENVRVCNEFYKDDCNNKCKNDWVGQSMNVWEKLFDDASHEIRYRQWKNITV